MATQVVELTGDEAKLIRSLQNVIKKEAEHEKKLNAIATAGGKAGKASKDGADKAATSQAAFASVLAKTVTAYVGVGQAMSLVVNLNKEVIKTNKEAFSGLQKQQSGNSKLLQISGGSAKEFNRLKSRADELASSTGLDREAARNLVFSAKSEGFEGSLDFIARNRQTFSTGSQATVAGQLPQLFAGTNASLTGPEAINATAKAAEKSRLNFEQLAQVAPIAAEGAAAAGFSMAETLAAVSQLSSKFTSGESAAQRFKAFAFKIAKDRGEVAGTKGGESDEKFAERVAAEDSRATRAQHSFRSLQERVGDIQGGPRAKTRAAQDARDLQLSRAQRAVDEFDQGSLTAKTLTQKAGTTTAARASLKGLNLADAVKAIAALPQEQRDKFLGGSQEATAGFQALQQQLPKIAGVASGIKGAVAATGTSASPLGAARAIAESDPAFRTVRENEIANVQREIAIEENRAIKEGQAQTGVTKALTKAEKGGSFGITIAAAEKAAGVVRAIPGGDRAAAPLVEAFTRDQSALTDSSQLGLLARFAQFGGSFAESFRPEKKVNMADVMMEARKNDQ